MLLKNLKRGGWDGRGWLCYADNKIWSRQFAVNSKQTMTFKINIARLVTKYQKLINSSLPLNNFRELPEECKGDM